MGYSRRISNPAAEPVTVDEAKTFLRIDTSAEDTLIGNLIKAAREHAEVITGRAIAQGDWVMVLDSHPYYTDTVQSQLAYPPSYYSLPRYSTTLWNYSQMIKLPHPPLKSVARMRSVQPDGTSLIKLPDVDFIVDRESEYGRIFPRPGQYWPPDLYVANALEIFFTAGYDPAGTAPDVHQATDGASPPTTLLSQQPDSTLALAMPERLRLAILMLVAHWYENREPTGKGLAAIPNHLDALLWGQAVVDFQPTRG